MMGHLQLIAMASLLVALLTWQPVCVGAASLRHESALDALFSALDSNKDGQVQGEEAAQYIGQAVGGTGLTTHQELQQAVARMLGRMDGNDVGTSVSREELEFHLLHSVLQGVRVWEWIKHGLGFPQYSDAFRINAVTVVDFPALIKDNGAVLQSDLGIVSAFHRDKMVRAIQHLVLGLGTPPSEPQAPSCTTTADSSLLLAWSHPPAGGSASKVSVHKYVLERLGLNGTWAAVAEVEDSVHAGDPAPWDGVGLYRLASWNLYGRSAYTTLDCSAQLACGRGGGGGQRRGSPWGSSVGPASSASCRATDTLPCVGPGCSSSPSTVDRLPQSANVVGDHSAGFGGSLQFMSLAVVLGGLGLLTFVVVLLPCLTQASCQRQAPFLHHLLRVALPTGSADAVAVMSANSLLALPTASKSATAAAAAVAGTAAAAAVTANGVASPTPLNGATANGVHVKSGGSGASSRSQSLQSLILLDPSTGSSQQHISLNGGDNHSESGSFTRDSGLGERGSCHARGSPNGSPRCESPLRHLLAAGGAAGGSTRGSAAASVHDSRAAVADSKPTSPEEASRAFFSQQPPWASDHQQQQSMGQQQAGRVTDQVQDDGETECPTCRRKSLEFPVVSPSNSERPPPLQLSNSGGRTMAASQPPLLPPSTTTAVASEATAVATPFDGGAPESPFFVRGAGPTFAGYLTCAQAGGTGGGSIDGAELADLELLSTSERPVWPLTGQASDPIAFPTSRIGHYLRPHLAADAYAKSRLCGSMPSSHDHPNAASLFASQRSLRAFDSFGRAFDAHVDLSDASPSAGSHYRLPPPPLVPPPPWQQQYSSPAEAGGTLLHSPRSPTHRVANAQALGRSFSGNSASRSHRKLDGVQAVQNEGGTTFINGLPHSSSMGRFDSLSAAGSVSFSRRGGTGGGTVGETSQRRGVGRVVSQTHLSSSSGVSPSSSPPVVPLALIPSVVPPAGTSSSGVRVCGYPECGRKLDFLHFKHNKTKHYCGRCQQYYCLEHTEYSPHGATGSCGIESRCVCVQCWQEFNPAYQAFLGNKNTLSSAKASAAATATRRGSTGNLLATSPSFGLLSSLLRPAAADVVPPNTDSQGASSAALGTSPEGRSSRSSLSGEGSSSTAAAREVAPKSGKQLWSRAVFKTKAVLRFARGGKHAEEASAVPTAASAVVAPLAPNAPTAGGTVLQEEDDKATDVTPQ